MNRLPVAVIPAYKPLPIVINIVKELLNSKSFQGVVCVNDGSGREFDNIFSELKTKMLLVKRNHIFISSFCNLFIGKYRHYCLLTDFSLG